MNYKEALNYITEACKFGSNLGLERTEKLLEILGNPHKKLKCIHIAGTNGKGSTTSMITEILMESGYKVGMYTSPYIEEFEERIQINRNNIEKNKLADIITKVSSAVDKVLELGYDNPTEFEIITVGMFYYFYKEKVDFAVVEVGLGGRLDSTNVLDPLLDVICSISYDHINILGDSIEEIANEKAGIIKGAPVVLYPQKKEVEEVIEKVCLYKKSLLLKVNNNVENICEYPIEKNKGYQKFRLKTVKDEYDITLPLLGVHQINNCITAITAIEKLIDMDFKIKKENIINGLKNVEWKARLEVLKNNPITIIDGAHNIDAINKLKLNIEKYFKYKNMTLILGILKDKQVEDMVKTITSLADRVITLSPNNNRAKSPEDLMKIVRKYNPNCQWETDYKKAYEKAVSYSKEEDIILICGSLYMVGDMRKIIMRK
ncbi:folylpolyglutamate synthase/dihydrofolate synthase family protein [Clostridium oceanicum]|uniref:tetrahydrofolate synthase n=1 Tax=Clostridium oceanicum TaxID=1543 RepID=A0ABN1JWK5_9CLOT